MFDPPIRPQRSKLEKIGRKLMNFRVLDTGGSDNGAMVTTKFHPGELNIVCDNFFVMIHPRVLETKNDRKRVILGGFFVILH